MLNQTQLDHMRERQQLSLMDTCRHLVHSSSQNDYNEPIESYTEVEEDVPCGVEQKTGIETQRDKDTFISYDAIIRLPFDFSLDEKDRLKITKRYGETITPIIYEIVSPIQSGPSGIRVTAKKVAL